MTAGLKAGDVVVAVNGTPVDLRTIDSAMKEAGGGSLQLIVTTQARCDDLEPNGRPHLNLFSSQVMGDGGLLVIKRSGIAHPAAARPDASEPSPAAA